MYEVDRYDSVVRLMDLPQPDPGAPVPVLVADEHRVEIAYVARQDSRERDGQVAVAVFVRPYAHMFGPPNDEAFAGHPLAARGLTPYGCFRIQASSWIRRLERMNAVHPHHRPERFEALTHFVVAFHDSTFECIAQAVRATLRPIDPQPTLSISLQA